MSEIIYGENKKIEEDFGLSFVVFQFFIFQRLGREGGVSKERKINRLQFREGSVLRRREWLIFESLLKD